jgi:hypothetical protein
VNQTKAVPACYSRPGCNVNINHNQMLSAIHRRFVINRKSNSVSLLSIC